MFRISGPIMRLPGRFTLSHQKFQCQMFTGTDQTNERVVQIDSRQPILEVENLRVVFASGRGRKRIQVNAVDGVSFEIYQGETFGLVGESGCGKTTLGRTIVRLYSPTSGTIRFRGRDVSGPMTKELRQYITDNMAMIFQDPVESLNPRMTVQEIIEEGLKVRGIKDPEVRQEMVFDILSKVGLTRSTLAASTSFQAPKAAHRHCAALIVKPSFVIADEPVSALMCPFKPRS